MGLYHLVSFFVSRTKELTFLSPRIEQNRMTSSEQQHLSNDLRNHGPKRWERLKLVAKNGDLTKISPGNTKVGVSLKDKDLTWLMVLIS